MKLLKKLSEACGIPGREDAIRKIVSSELKGKVTSMKTDPMGNIIAFKRGSGKGTRKRVMLAGHMDEIGFVVQSIDDKGFIRIHPLGGFDPKTLITKRVMVHGTKSIVGVIGSKPPHIMKPEERGKVPEISQLFVDVGLPGKKVRKTVSVGDQVTLDVAFSPVGDYVTGKAMDDRIGVYIMIEVMKKLRGHKVDVYGVGTVQEEVGIRGAMTSTFDVAPDIGIALDVTLACDIPGANSDPITKLGEGCAIKILDSASISNPKLVKKFVQIAKKNKIKHQMEILPRGGTDAGAMQRGHGAAAAITISIPCRYVHSVVEMISMKDVQAAVNLIVKFIQTAHEGSYEL
ncbi:MAG: M42 family peptidase [Planctomycetota bacterium]|nr:MAG: M42 family peptidase [Planctomycetota bacterium]